MIHLSLDNTHWIGFCTLACVFLVSVVKLSELTWVMYEKFYCTTETENIQLAQ